MIAKRKILKFIFPTPKVATTKQIQMTIAKRNSIFLEFSITQKMRFQFSFFASIVDKKILY